MVKIEMESELEQWKLRAQANDNEDPNYLAAREFFDQGDSAIASRYPELPNSYFSDALCFVPEQFSASFLEEKELQRDLPFLMQFWNHLISRSFSGSKELARASADIYRSVRLEIAESGGAIEVEDDHKVPDEGLRSQLESEIKEMMERLAKPEDDGEPDCLVPTRKRRSTDSITSESDKRPRP